jgi:hypothetical protein
LRTPVLKPSKEGEYFITETKSNRSISIYSGKWEGTLSNVCSDCHSSTISSWQKTKHAKYNIACESCHGPQNSIAHKSTKKVLTKAQELLLTQECVLNVMKKNTKNGKNLGMRILN